MPIRLSDTQKITNVPSSRDIGALVNLDTSRDPNVNNPVPPLPRIQSGLATQTDTFELIDQIDFSSNSPIFNVSEILFPLLGKYSRYKVIFEAVDNASAGNQCNLTYESTSAGSNSYYYEFVSESGTSAAASQTWTSSSNIVLGNSTSFPSNSGGMTGELDIFFPYSSLESSAIPAYQGPRAFWLLECFTYRTYGHGNLYTSSYPVNCIRLSFTYAPTGGRITCYGLPRN